MSTRRLSVARSFVVGTPAARGCLPALVLAGAILAAHVSSAVADDQAPREASWQFRNAIVSVAFSPDGKKLALGNQHGTVTVLEMPSRKWLSSFPAPQWLEQIAFSPDGRVLVGAGENGLKCELVLWETSPKWTPLRPLVLERGPSKPFALSPDGTSVAVQAQDCSIHIYDFSKRKLVTRLRGHKYACVCLAFSPDGKTLASGGTEDNVRIWDIASGRTMRVLTDENQASVCSVAFLDGGRELAWVGLDTPHNPGPNGATIRISDVRTGTLRQQLSGHENTVSALIPLPDGKLISGSADRTVRLWDLKTAREIGKVRVPGWAQSLSLSPDGSTLACGASELEGEYEIWDMATLFNGLAAPPKSMVKRNVPK